MPHVKIEPSGCIEHYGMVRVRLAMYLDPIDARYSEHSDGSPFHNHFMYDNLSATPDEIEALATYHLANFYEAWVQEVSMRAGWDTKHRIRPRREYKEKTDADILIRKQLCADRLVLIKQLRIGYPFRKHGKLFPATAIDVGSLAIDRNTSLGNVTLINEPNPANDTGLLDTVAVWFKTQPSACKVGTFYPTPSAPNFTCRDWEELGSVPSGSKQTFTGLDCEVELSDYMGIYCPSGAAVEVSNNGSGGWYKTGDHFEAGSVSYSYYNQYEYSVYGTGETIAVGSSRGWMSK